MPTDEDPGTGATRSMANGRPTGIVGYSAGGNLVHLIARGTFGTADEPVFIANIDTYRRKLVQRLRADVYFRYGFSSATMVNDQRRRLRRHGGDESLPRVTASVLGCTTYNVHLRIRRRIALGDWRGNPPQLQGARLLFDVSDTPLPIPLYLYTAPESVARHADPTLGWNRWLGESLVLRPMPSGNHINCIEGDAAGTVASMIRDDFVAALRDTPPREPESMSRHSL